jgi:hypothetical protein
MDNTNEFSKAELEKFLDFIEDVSSRSGNDWFGRSLIQRLGSNFSMKSNSLGPENSQIKDIYEYCIANVLEQQAVNFYKWVDDVSLRETLILDFIRMEKFRREDRFEDFCLAAFQQVEAMVNFVINTNEEYLVRGADELHKLAFSRFSPTVRKKIKVDGNTVGEYLFGNKSIKPLAVNVENSFQRPIGRWEAFQRVKLMVYYHHYDGEMNYSEVDTQFSIFIKLKNMRDANHRNTETVEDRKQREVEDIRSNRTKYYIKFSDLLIQFCTWSNKKGSQ